MKIIGITGGIASGKSTVTRMFEALGGISLSADLDARAVLSEGSPALAEVFTLFPEVRRPDGSLDRAALAARIFSDPSDKKRLESITHPAIISRMRAAIDAARASQEESILFYEVPLLYERDLADLFDAVIAVLATPSLQAERLQARERAAGRPALSESDITNRLAAQMSPDEKARLADHVIRTDSPLSQTEEQVRQVWNMLTSV
jgi:dephospho-CoA kinase